MSKIDFTKKALADALIELMKKKPLNKISIKDITDACDLNRHTFYYHFKDKQDLVCWIFDCAAEKNFKFPQIEEIAQGKQTFFIRKIISYMYENKSFYINALNSDTQNSLQEHLFKYIYRFREIQIKALLRGRKMDPKGIEFLAGYFTYAIGGLIIQWAKNGMVDPPPTVFYDKCQDVGYQCISYLLDKYSIPSNPDHLIDISKKPPHN